MRVVQYIEKERMIATYVSDIEHTKSYDKTILTQTFQYNVLPMVIFICLGNVSQISNVT